MNKFLNILPVVIMVESFAASVPLFICGRWGSGLYWFSAGLLNFAVIFFIKKYGWKYETAKGVLFQDRDVPVLYYRRAGRDVSVCGICGGSGDQEVSVQNQEAEKLLILSFEFKI